MSVLTDIVIAGEDDVDAVLRAPVPSERFPGIDGQGVDMVKLDLLRAVIADTEWSAATLKDFETLGAVDKHAGPWVYRIPADLVEALAALEGSDRRHVAESWAEIDEFKLDNWRRSHVRRLLLALCELATQAQAEGKLMLLWMSV